MKKNKLLSIVAGVLVLVGVVAFNYASADNNGRSNNEDHGNSEQAKEAHKRGTTLEVHISNKGKVDVRGAKVTSVSGNVVNASTSWGSVNLNWAVNVLLNANVTRKAGGVRTVSQILVGDLINFKGDLVSTSSSPIMVDASMVKDWTLEQRNTSVSGKVKSVDVANNKFVLSSNRDGDITVITSNATLFKKGDGNAVFADVIVGVKVSVKGLYDSQLKKLTADEVKIKIPEVDHENN